MGLVWFGLGLLLGGAAVLIWAKAGGGGTTGSGGGGGVGPNDPGVCVVNGETQPGTMTLKQCKDAGGTSFTPSDPSKPTVDPKTGSKL
jgi:hypothetical protein